VAGVTVGRGDVAVGADTALDGVKRRGDMRGLVLRRNEVVGDVLDEDALAL